jgi:hypothetical protein
MFLFNVKFNKINNYQIIIISILSLFLSNFLLNTKELSYNLLSEQLIEEDAIKAFKTQQKWSWVSYFILPIIILIRSSFVALCLSIGLFFYDMESKYNFKHLFKIALLGEFIFLLVGFLKLYYFLSIKTNYSLLDLQQYYPLSYINFLDISKIKPWLIYPLQTLNLLEIGYFFVLVYGLHKLLKNKYLKSFEIVAISYGSGLIIWLCFIMFLTLNMT